MNMYYLVTKLNSDGAFYGQQLMKVFSKENAIDLATCGARQNEGSKYCVFHVFDYPHETIMYKEAIISCELVVTTVVPKTEDN